MLVNTAGRWGGTIAQDFIERFEDAYDREVQAWVDATRRGEVTGPSAWDGYAAAAVCEAGVRAPDRGRARRGRTRRTPRALPLTHDGSPGTGRHAGLRVPAYDSGWCPCHLWKGDLHLGGRGSDAPQASPERSSSTLEATVRS